VGYHLSELFKSLEKLFAKKHTEFFEKLKHFLCYPKIGHFRADRHHMHCGFYDLFSHTEKCPTAKVGVLRDSHNLFSTLQLYRNFE
jgi:hypothetical protein